MGNIETWIRSMPDGLMLSDIDVLYCMEILRRNGWNRTHSAKDMNMGITTLRFKIRRLKALGYHIPSSSGPKGIADPE